MKDRIDVKTRNKM